MPVGVANIKVIGVGGAGNNAVNRMIHADADIKNATFIAANTDMQALSISLAPIKIQLGALLTQGLGAGADPEIGRLAAEESIDEIRESIRDANLLFITAGMGGGTGTGATPIIASVARELGILTIAVVTKPLNFEGKRRMDNAVAGIAKLRECVDTLLVVPNEKVNSYVAEKTSLLKAFHIADDILRQGIKGISDIISTPALINLDFADIRTIMKDKGNAHIGTGRAKGDNRTLDAVRQAVQSPLLETNIQGATGIIVYVSGGESLTLEEVNEAISLVREVVDESANIIWGVGIDVALDKDVAATIIATGFGMKPESRFIAKPIFTDSASKPQYKERMDLWYGADSQPTNERQPVTGTQQPPVATAQASTEQQHTQTNASHYASQQASVPTTPHASTSVADTAPEPVNSSRVEIHYGYEIPEFLRRLQDEKNRTH
ncbi:MAG: cell division protein FtsZ [Christensenellaceae bacterium]|jgi:cell division protein FtsZ|nr:cell division protein FtsZ [Christensenellaceae bacterium]